MESQNQAAMDKYKCQYCNYKSMYYKNMQDHVAVREICYASLLAVLSSLPTCKPN